jgi:hypothetical protein
VLKGSIGEACQYDWCCEEIGGEVAILAYGSFFVVIICFKLLIIHILDIQAFKWDNVALCQVLWCCHFPLLLPIVETGKFFFFFFFECLIYQLEDM